MNHQQHSSVGRFLRKGISVTLAVTMLLSMVIVGNVFGSASAAETLTEGDYTYTLLDDGTAQITRYSGSASALTVPATLGGSDVSSIGNRAFEQNDDISAVTISEGIQTIGDYAFYRCRALQSVDVPSTVKTIADRAFSDCPILGTVSLREGVEKLGNRFLSGTVVSDIYIPSTVTFANEAFAEAELLDTVTFAEGITAIPNDMFEQNNSLRTLTIPDTVTKLGNDSLCRMGSLETIVIPDTVTEMGQYVLYACPNLRSVTIGKGLTRIPNNAFEWCSTLKDIVIPDNITEIGSAAFKDCQRLSQVTLSKNLTNIGSYSFERTALTGITLPASLTMGSYPFNGCQSLKTFIFSDGTTVLPEGLFQNTAVENVTIPEGVTELPTSLFNGCKSLKTVSLPSELKTIGDHAFANCSSLETIDIPQSVKTINNNAFEATASLKSCTFHEGLLTLGNRLFLNSALTSIFIPKTLSNTGAPFEDSNITDVTFSDGIATLTDNLFYNAKKLTAVKIPDTVVKIGNNCFRGSNVEAVVIPDSVKTLGTSIFEECDNLYAVKFGAGVRKLPQFCFYGCDVLQNVIIPETVYDMDNSVFERSGLGYLKLPQSMHYISSTAFKDCAKLTKVDCSDELERIGDYAFERCYEFTTLNTAVKDIDFNNSTFKDCPKFTDKRFFVFNPANTGIESTANIGVDHTLVHFTVKYDIRDDWKDDDTTMRRLILNYPNNLDVITNSFVAEGFDFDNMTYSGDYRSFDLTGAKTRGELRFSAYLNLSDDVAKSLTAEVSFRHMGTDFQKPLGDVQLTTAKISLFAPSSVTEPKISVSGYSAAADKDVNITMTRVKDGASVTHTVTPNPYTGKYTAENLDILPEGKTAVNDEVFEVYAVSDGKKSDVIRFTYTPGAIRVVKATETVNIKKFTGPHQTNLSHGTQTNTYDITGVFTKGTAPVVLINPVEMLQFQIQLENDENICALVLMSHKGSDWRFMPLFYDAETDMWIGEGYFNIPDHELVQGYNYVPGAFNLFWFYGKREDTYKSHFYGGKSDEAVGDGPSLFGGEEEEIFYYDKDGKPHGQLGDYHDTFWETVKDVFVDIVTGEWTDVPKDATVGGLKGLWEWGNTDDNFFRMTHGGVRLGPDGLPILPGDGADMYNHDASKDGRQRNAIDPSGMVYEAVEGNPVEGATATIYKRNEDTGEWEIWNAADYEQENPLLTNNEGAYAWLTDEGRFKVTITKEGYEPQTSEEFDIPPEKLGLNFGLVDKTTHPKATVTANEQAGSYTLKFSKFMQTDTVNTDTVQTEGLTDVTITPVYLADGDAYADTFLVTGTKTQRAVTFSVTDAARSYSDVAAEASSETITTSMLGDVNGDGKIDITDATLIQLHVAQSKLLEGEDFAVADVNGDNKVDITDATLIQLHTAGMKSF